MHHPLVHPLETAADFIRKSLVTFTASQAADLLELVEGKTTDRTRHSVVRHRDDVSRIRGSFSSQHRIREREAGGISHPLLLSALFTKAHLLHLSFNQLGEEDSRLFLAEVTLHAEEL